MKKEIDKDGVVRLTMNEAEYREWQRQNEILENTFDVDCPLTDACKWLQKYSENWKPVPKHK